MTTPVRRARRGRPRRSFDLRATALFFGLLALLLIILGLVFRTATATLEHRPAWAVVLVVIAAVAVLAVRRRRRRFSAKRAARRATAALEEATRTALDALETPPSPTAPAPAARIDAEVPAAGGPRAPGPRVAPEGIEPTVVLTDGTEPTVLLPERTAATVAAADTGLAQDTVAGADAVAPIPEDVVHTGPLDYDALDAEEFEHAVAGLCERDGCTGVEVVGGAGDLGADVLAVAPDGRRLVIQCKRYCDTNRVGSQDLQRFGGTCYTVHEADVAIVVTTSDFTAPAAEYAEQCGIVCVDGGALRAWSDGTGPRPWDAPA